jgi:hypothetical protein
MKMKLEIDLEDKWAYEESLSKCIQDEIKEAVRRKVKAILRKDQSEIAAAVEAAAKIHAKQLLDSAMKL